MAKGVSTMGAATLYKKWFGELLQGHDAVWVKYDEPTVAVEPGEEVATEPTKAWDPIAGEGRGTSGLEWL